MNTKSTYTPAKINYTKPRRPSRTVPNQSLSIKTIMERFSRGIPVNSVKRQGVYVDQDEHDLEKLANASFDEKASMAEHLKAQNERIQSAFNAEADAKTKAAEAARQKATRTGIDNDDEGGGEDEERVPQPRRPKPRGEKEQ